ncbi:TRAP transporter TatT component family protein [Marinicellulosiphila megalodicopiae]|uniref:TRAP transporter TatT component family protein n=1 Tax=Marinicellulosiphila megalodicopiae TaxID=2724896 RepID=UPI003BB164D2
MRILTIVCCVLFLQSCAITRLPNDIGYGVLNSDDLVTVKEGLPTYLLLVDGALITYPESESLLLTASSLNSAYGGVFVEDEARKLKMTQKSFDLAQRAMCLHRKSACKLMDMSFGAFEQEIAKIKKEKDLPYLYAVASSWTSLIQLTSSDYNSIAQLGRVELMMKKVVSLDEQYENGMPLVYLGALNSLLPPSLGGKPEIAKDYFERAIKVNPSNLIAKVMYAEGYGRLMFEQELHDRLLNEVLEADSNFHGLTLQNEYAKKEAKRLLDGSYDYF